MNAGCAYLRAHGSPRNLVDFRARVPLAAYEDLVPRIEEIQAGAGDILFSGRPIAYERTGGSGGGAKLIPYSSRGLDDFRLALIPWLLQGTRRFQIAGLAYFSLSPATRQPETINGVPVGLPDGAYLGTEAARVLAEMTAVPFGTAALTDVDGWRKETLRHLASAADLEFISCWSPTFLLRLLDELPDPVAMWPRLKLVSCWASAASAPFAAELAARLAHAHLQPKGLMSTECVVSVPDAGGRALLNADGFFEFERDGAVFLPHELECGPTYEVIATTASGLYRYRTGDLVSCEAFAGDGRPYLAFVGRGELSSDLVGEKLTEAFVADCLSTSPRLSTAARWGTDSRRGAARCSNAARGFQMLVPAAAGDGYVLAADAAAGADVQAVEQRLCRNPQYAFARRIGQLRPVRLVEMPGLYDRYVDVQVKRGIRMGDVKPLALRSERSWVESLGVPA
jgi:hypothetical protein